MNNIETPIFLKRKDVTLAYTLLRIVFGINFFVHGLVRIGNMGGFIQSMVDRFQELAPSFVIIPFAALTTPVELISGFLMIIGLQTRNAIIAGFLLMMPLMFGVCLLQQWDIASSQLIYCLVFFILLAGCSLNTISIDRLIHNRNS
ncbi:MAG: DoxX family protein [Okeania sp. SIO2C2]|uniref:DoxX family protein n=1 Tax=Okeania sp. SIO2C2 TaxID=2607787 RepID=UPI0013BAE2D3|nr:DoxX family protein [Okeania sp. SIO2C2]NEP90872.1 DoxX family protein [Okeania sp. SIO2C2]